MVIFSIRRCTTIAQTSHNAGISLNHMVRLVLILITKEVMAKTFKRGRVEDWQGRRGILRTSGSDAWFFVRAYNMEPDGQETPVEVGEEVAFQWVHEGVVLQQSL